MRLGTLSVLAGAILIVVALLIGCSDDKTSNPVTYGDLQDPEFAPVKVQIDGAITEILDDLLDGFDNLYVQPGDTTSVRADLMPPEVLPDPNDDPDTLIAVYLQGWHYVYASYAGDYYQSHLHDSVQYQQAGDPVEHPSTNVDYIHNIVSWEITALDPEQSHINYDGRTEFEIANLDLTVSTINGSSAKNVEVFYTATDTTFTDNYTFETVVNNLQVAETIIGWSNSCPLSGVITMGLDRDYAWTNATTNGEGTSSWTVTASFDNGEVVVTARNGASTWRYTADLCDIPGQ